MCALTAHVDGDDSLLTRLRWCHLCQQHVDQRVQYPVPNAGERHLIQWTRKYSKERKTTKAMKYVVRYLLPMRGFKICALSSAQIERHRVANWCPVALIGAIAGSTGKWSKKCNEVRNPQGTKLKVSSFWIYHYHRQMPARTILWSVRDFQIQLGLAPGPIREQGDVWWRPVFVCFSASILLQSIHRQPRRNMEHH